MSSSSASATKSGDASCCISLISCESCVAFGVAQQAVQVWLGRSSAAGRADWTAKKRERAPSLHTLLPTCRIRRTAELREFQVLPLVDASPEVDGDSMALQKRDARALCVFLSAMRLSSL